MWTLPLKTNISGKEMVRDFDLKAFPKQQSLTCSSERTVPCVPIQLKFTLSPFYGTDYLILPVGRTKHFIRFDASTVFTFITFIMIACFILL